MTELQAPAAAPAAGLTAAEIAARVGGVVQGDSAARVSGIAPLDRAGPDQLSFLTGARYAPLFAASGAGVVLLPPELAASEGRSRARVIVEKPHDAMLSLLPHFHRPAAPVPGVHPTAVLGRGVALGERVTIGPGAVIGDGATLRDGAWVEAQAVIGAGVVVGEDSRVYPHATLYPGTILGKRVMVHSGVRLGSDGFGYVHRDGQHAKIPHVGRCIIEDDVEIGANTTIDRGSIDDTVIGAGTKIDNLVHLAHNVRVGRLCLIMAQVGIAGSVRVEDGCIIAGQAGVAGHLTIGRGARLAARAGAFGDIPPGETWSGYPARPHKEALRTQAATWKLAGMLRRLERLLATHEAPTGGRKEDGE